MKKTTHIALLLPLLIATDCSDDCYNTWGLEGRSMELVRIDEMAFPPRPTTPPSCNDLAILGGSLVVDFEAACESRDQGAVRAPSAAETWEPLETSAGDPGESVASAHRVVADGCDGVMEIRLIHHQSDLLAEEELFTEEGRINAFWEPIEGETAPWTVVRRFITDDPASCPQLGEVGEVGRFGYECWDAWPARALPVEE